MKNESPKSASTVILVRPEAGGGFELFLIRRPERMEFLGGVYAFPGGSVKKEDCNRSAFSRCCGLTSADAQKILGNRMAAQFAMGYWVAAIRELFEEVGVLLAVGESGQALEIDRQPFKDRLAGRRQALLAGDVDFPALLESETLYADAASLRYLSHWLTPEEFSIRFDTRFYLAPLPQGQTPLPDSQEVAASLWLTPDRALKLCERGELPMIFPTFASIRTLANFDSWEMLRNHFRLDDASSSS
jgi:8-oxo-dGTP pyrophosphatase MutT (NUDIX family)